MVNLIETIEVSTAEEFLNLLDIKDDRWWIDGAQQSWVFRGLGTTDYSLIPSARRALNCNPLRPLIEKLGNPSHWQCWTRAELLTVRNFLERASAIGLLVPSAKIIAVSAGYSLDEPQPPIEDYFIAQHHGVPTRFLDWSYNPIIAAHFALVSAFGKGSAELCVWALDLNCPKGAIFADRIANDGNPPNVTSMIGCDFGFHFDEPGRNDYLRHQRGMFVSLRGANVFHSIEGRWPSMEDYCDPEFVVRSSSDNSILTKFVLKQDQYARLAELLEREGISRAGLMPTLDNVSKDVITWLERQA